jgi:hypothetical protein
MILSYRTIMLNPFCRWAMKNKLSKVGNDSVGSLEKSDEPLIFLKTWNLKIDTANKQTYNIVS